MPQETRRWRLSGAVAAWLIVFVPHGAQAQGFISPRSVTTSPATPDAAAPRIAGTRTGTGAVPWAPWARSSGSRSS